MNFIQRSQYEVWANFRVAKKSVDHIREFFINEIGVQPESLVKNLHLTVYHSRRPMPNVKETKVSCILSVDTMETRFMVLAPGGENPRPDLIPADRKIGIRIHRTSQLRIPIEKYRSRFFLHENRRILGKRKPSTKLKSAFGARHFQPHIALLLPGNNMPLDLKTIGDAFRDYVQEIHFDQFQIISRRNV
ncbi:hypothetical protein MUGA111182_17780 [Mucilaginibacter galii]|uniref:Uncharacterized protein n=1 Tax=Mucilaginibacter galii TaxID=2005073 RepID=A0A917JD70_9SPHI|nr:hypothetical protein [Mucilaginibacter galii]GGI52412.1 hypothetical protein GCM10011425_36240 [Mucilaginibacter galii]